MHTRFQKSTGILMLIGMIVLVSLISTVLWYNGLEKQYARMVVSLTNVSLQMAGRETRISVETEADGKTHFFKVRTRINNRGASYPQKFGPLMLPVVMILSWQLVSSFFRNRKQAIFSALINFGIFIGFQIIFLLLLTVYYTSDTARFIYEMFMGSFYMIALLVIILDYVHYPLKLDNWHKRLFAKNKKAA